MKKKIYIIIVSILSICSFLVGTSVAWLSSTTDTVVNTFTYGDINIKIEETDTKDNDNNEFTKINASVLRRGGRPAVARPMILGITKASLETDSLIRISIRALLYAFIKHQFGARVNYMPLTQDNKHTLVIPRAFQSHYSTRSRTGHNIVKNLNVIL